MATPCCGARRCRPPTASRESSSGWATCSPASHPAPDWGMALRRSLGPVLATFYGVGMIVGAGIYSVIGAAAGEAGNGLWLSFAIGAAAALLSGLSYAELAAMHPRAGAEYVYLREAFPRRRWIPTVV